MRGNPGYGNPENYPFLHAERAREVKTRIDIDGRAWKPCPAPSVKSWRDTRWRTDDGWELEYRTYSPGDCDTGWHLYGPMGEGTGVFGVMMGGKLADAMAEAGLWIAGKRSW